jgi:hypothetical protein
MFDAGDAAVRDARPRDDRMIAKGQADVME